MNVGEMQRKLSVWATQEPERKFYNLYSLLLDKEWLRLAHDHVKHNAGSVTAGCDGITMGDFDEHLEANLQHLREELQSETFVPQPVRRVNIPKPNGKIRPLGIAAIRDRIVQEALRMILEPIFEADFSPYSFGFRPTRRTMDAVRHIQWCTAPMRKYYWVIEGDISSYFDTISQPKLLRLVARRIKDKKLLTLLWKFLRAGVMEKRTFRDTKLGTPQGGIISPLLANIYLHELDRYMQRYTALSPREKDKRRQQGLGNFVYVRYCDDFVVLCNGTKAVTEVMREELSQFLRTTLKLTLSKEKTKITHITEGFTFLGFWIQQCPGAGGMTTKILIPKAAMATMRATLARALAPSAHQDSVHAKILAINRLISGWCRYYQYTNTASTQFHRLEYVLFWRMAHWLGGKFRMAMPEVMRRYLRDHTFATEHIALIKPTRFRTLRYRDRILKPNPYLTQARIDREELPSGTSWRGYEARPGMADLRPYILERDQYTCQQCGTAVTHRTAEIDHIRPVRRFKRPIDANVEGNLQTLCLPCHDKKTQADRQGESRVR